MMANETNLLRDYLTYIPQRLAYLKRFGVNPSNYEYKYYSELHREIKEYLKSNKVFRLYLMHKISIEQYKAFYNTSERTSYRILAKQRAKLISFIVKKEKELLEKYPQDGLKIDTSVVGR